METVYIGDLVPSIASYENIIEKYKKSLEKRDFYEEPIGEDFIYPDW